MRSSDIEVGSLYEVRHGESTVVVRVNGVRGGRGLVNKFDVVVKDTGHVMTLTTTSNFLREVMPKCPFCGNPHARKLDYWECMVLKHANDEEEEIRNAT